jgi:hypothetical protein
MRARTTPRSIEQISPLDGLLVADRPGLCDACHHRAGTPSQKRQLLGALFSSRKPKPAHCKESDCGNNASGWPEMCSCTNPFHGS